MNSFSNSLKLCTFLLTIPIADVSRAAVITEGDAVFDGAIKVATNYGDGELSITGPTYLITNGVQVGTYPDTTGRLVLDGGTVDVNSGPVAIGDLSTGNLEIRDGGRLIATNLRDGIAVGRRFDGDGTISVDGFGSQVFADGTDLQLGGPGRGALLVGGGAFAQFQNGVFDGGLARIGIGSAHLLASGHNTLVEFQQDLRLGAAIVAIDSGATLASQTLDIGDFRNSQLHIRIADQGSRLVVADQMSVGSGNLQILDGALLEAQEIDLNRATVRVSGAGTRLQLGKQPLSFTPDNFTIGNFSPATLHIDDAAFAYGGTVKLGDGSQRSQIEIASGAHWLLRSMEIEAASELTLDRGLLTVGGFPELGTLRTIDNHGVIQGSGAIHGGVWNDRGRISVGYGQDLHIDAILNTSFSRIEVTNGTLKVNNSLFNDASSTVMVSDGVVTQDRIGTSDFSGPIFNQGSISFIFGANVLDADLENQGTVFIGGSSETTFSGSVLDEGVINVAVDSIAVFQGPLTTAGIQGGGTARIENDFIAGVRSPPRPILLHGDLQLSPTSNLILDLNEVEHDTISVTRDAYLGGSLELELWSPIKIDTTFEILTAATIDGTFDQVPEVGTDLGFGVIFDGITYNPDSVVVSLLQQTGDVNSDGRVDSLDLGAWSAGYGLTAGALLSDGDADRDGDVDGADWLMLQREFQRAASAASGQTVPEPTGLVLLLMSALSLSGRRRR